MRNTFIIILTLMSFISFGQDTTKTNFSKREGYKEWTKYRNSFRFGLGLQKSFFSEVGISRHKYIYNDLGFASSAYYTSLEWTPKFIKSNENIYGLKVGYEINARILALGLEVKYQTNFENNDFVITPKIGFGAMGIVNLFYGYNISTTGSPFPNIGHNQFSIVCNLSRSHLKKGKNKLTQ